MSSSLSLSMKVSLAIIATLSLVAARVDAFYTSTGAPIGAKTFAPSLTFLRSQEQEDDAAGYDSKWQIDDSYTTTPSGLRYKDQVVGSGDSPDDGATIDIHYSMFFDDFSSGADGRKYFDTRDNNPKGQPLSFQFGEKANILKGWAEGMSTMKEGGKRTLIIPPDLGYGDEGLARRATYPAIPSGAYLKFEVEMVSVDNSIITKFRRLIPKPSSLLE